MTDDSLTPRGRLVLGALVIAMGAFVVLVASDALDMHYQRTASAPPWIGMIGGLVFVLAGGALMIGARGASDGKLPATAPWILRALQHAVILVLVGLMATIGTWVAFGPGERAFTMSGFGMTGDDNLWLGRAMFGVGALITWTFFVAVAWRAQRELFRRGS